MPCEGRASAGVPGADGKDVVLELIRRGKTKLFWTPVFRTEASELRRLFYVRE